jgi:hypothetical protein
VVVLFIVVFHGRGYRSRRKVAIAVNVAIAFVVFSVIAGGCSYSSYLLDVDRCEWKNSVDALKNDRYKYLIRHRRSILIRRIFICPPNDVKRHCCFAVLIAFVPFYIVTMLFLVARKKAVFV